MPLDLVKFFEFDRLFHLRPAIALTTIYWLLAFFGIFVLASLIVWIIAKTKATERYQLKILNKYASMLLVMGLLGWLWTGIRYEKIFFLAGRFWFLVWLVGLAVWFYFIVKYQTKTVPLARKQAAERKMFNKYLPKKNKS
ncbi:MAG TPA: hypothetical protein PKL09_04395 [bacterium]|nr:hypothetical protein [bacterium]HNS34450.1 hypothetical protein [bacterium]